MSTGIAKKSPADELFGKASEGDATRQKHRGLSERLYSGEDEDLFSAQGEKNKVSLNYGESYSGR